MLRRTLIKTEEADQQNVNFALSYCPYIETASIKLQTASLLTAPPTKRYSTAISRAYYVQSYKRHSTRIVLPAWNRRAIFHDRRVEQQYTQHGALFQKA